MLKRGDIVRVKAGTWAGMTMRVVAVRSINTRFGHDPVITIEILRCRQVDPAPQQTVAGAPNAGTLIDFYDNEVTLVATGESVP